MSLMLREPMNSLTYSLMLNEYVAHWDVGSKGIHYKRLLYATLSTLRCLCQGIRASFRCFFFISFFFLVFFLFSVWDMTVFHQHDG